MERLEIGKCKVLGRLQRVSIPFLEYGDFISGFRLDISRYYYHRQKGFLIAIGYSDGVLLFCCVGADEVLFGFELEISHSIARL